MDLLSHQRFQDECLALQNREAEDIIQVMQKVKCLISSSHFQGTLLIPVQILVQSASDHPDRVYAFKILYSLAEHCKNLVAVRTVKLDGMEEYIVSGSNGSISKAAYNGNQVAVKAIRISQMNRSQAERVRHRIVLAIGNILNLGEFRRSEIFFYGT